MLFPHSFLLKEFKHSPIDKKKHGNRTSLLSHIKKDKINARFPCSQSSVITS